MIWDQEVITDLSGWLFGHYRAALSNAGDTSTLVTRGLKSICFKVTDLYIKR